MATTQKWTTTEIALTIVLFVLGIIPGVIYLCIMLKKKGYMDKVDNQIKQDFNEVKQDIHNEVKQHEEHKEEAKKEPEKVGE